ncbi:glycosyltransferase family 2 protein [Exiguobacterium aurantiacum]|uniref:glycosyltransferase family 2 protein n=1 Tax=Exiguobacterium aurantiacum TaxID=33987 RepID=UPI001E596448|nr:glycosyltransferase [Exiguobacterium aurantiacum]
MLVILINYKNSIETVNYVEELSRQNLFNQLMKIRIVDNSENEEEYYSLKNKLEKYKNVEVINPNENLGYFNAANLAFKKYVRENSLPEWVIISNTDISYESQDFFEQLLTLYSKGINGIIAPSILSSSSMTDQNPYAKYRFTKGKLVFYKNLYKSQFLTTLASYFVRMKRSYKKQTSTNENYTENPTSEIYAPHGAFIIFNKLYFQNGGDLNYKSFLFCEEIYLGELSKANGLQVVYDNRFKVIHHEHSTVSLLKKNKLLHYSKESIEYILKEFY